jgi:NitT/TauT family transport system substrate-binding protein
MKPCGLMLRLMAGVALLITLAGSASAESRPPLSFGTLPVIQALPLFVADEMGFFKTETLNVDIVPFRTALDKDVAMTTGRLDGYFGDLFTPIVLRAGGYDVRIVALNFITGQGRRMFGILASPKSNITSPAELADIPVAGSKNTIIDYVTVTLLEQAGVPADKIRLLDSKNIPLRLQMLMSEQVKAATLPEPLVNLAEAQGATVLADDGRSDLTATVLVFSEKAIQTRPLEITAFFRTIRLAVDLINRDPERVREIMNKHCHIPKSLHGTYPVPTFPDLSVPDEDRVQAAVQWLVSQAGLKSTPQYGDLVDGRFIQP